MVFHPSIGNFLLYEADGEFASPIFSDHSEFTRGAIKIFETSGIAGFAMMDSRYERQQMAVAFGVCYRYGEPAAASSERIFGLRESHPPSSSAQTAAAVRRGEIHAR